MIAFAVESVTEIIRAKLAGEADVEVKRSAYNDFNLTYSRRINHLMEHHAKQLGHASVMSWRIYMEYMWFFGLIVPMYVGKWHLDLAYIRTFRKNMRNHIDKLFADIYQQLNELVDRGANIGLMDAYRADQLIGDYSAVKHLGNYLENTKLEPRRCNIFASVKYTHFYVAIWYAMLQWKGFGLSGLLAPGHLYHFFSLLKTSAYASLGELVYLIKTRTLPANTQVAKVRQEFTSYRYQTKLQPWIEAIASSLPSWD